MYKRREGLCAEKVVYVMSEGYVRRVEIMLWIIIALLGIVIALLVQLTHSQCQPVVSTPILHDTFVPPLSLPPIRHLAFIDYIGKGERKWLIKNLNDTFNIQEQELSATNESSFVVIIFNIVGIGRIENVEKQNIIDTSAKVKRVIVLQVKPTDRPSNKTEDTDLFDGNKKISVFKLQVPAGKFQTNNLDEDTPAEPTTHKTVNGEVIKKMKDILTENK